MKRAIEETRQEADKRLWLLKMKGEDPNNRYKKNWDPQAEFDARKRERDTKKAAQMSEASRQSPKQRRQRKVYGAADTTEAKAARDNACRDARQHAQKWSESR